MMDAELKAKAEKMVQELDIPRLKNEGLLAGNDQFFPSVHYPPITMYPPITEEALFQGYQVPPDRFFDMYVHIPFCIKYCAFCHYPVKLGELAEEKDRYLAALEKEMDLYMARLGIKKFKARSVLFGGGTPTYLTPKQLARNLDFFCARTDLSAKPQFSYDVDPITITDADGQARLELMREHGVDRLTIGVQSLDDGLLKAMNRHHDAAEAMRSVRMAKEAGFKVNVEFIFGYPGQTLETWADTLEKAVRLDADEIQLYRLKVVPYGDHTGAITKKFGVKRADFPDLERTMLMKAYAMAFLPKSGYHEHLGRVYSRTAWDFSRYAHDQCFNLFDQVGFGLTAFSSLRDRYGLNTQDFAEYYSMIAGGKLPVNRGLVRSAEDQLRWAVVLPLKNRRVIKAAFRKITGKDLNEVFKNRIAALKSFGLVCEDDKTLALTPKGRFFADEVCHQFHHPDYVPFPRETYHPGQLFPYND
ncbi:MAG: coproporphyrinogen III oxidase family protein [Elusimicrobia bacterium]|nr:coproporphyrinogen III oxidase family protein [Elusimicrobiota bacterium]